MSRRPPRARRVAPVAAPVAAPLAALALAGALALLVATGCGGGVTAHRELTERERDSTLGKSAIPGAAAVTRTLAESDSMTARAARQNAAVPPSGQ